MTPSPRPRILIAEDDEQVRRSVDRALRLEGFATSLAPDGIAALTEAVSDPPDAIVLDLMMPGTDGMTVCRRLRAAGYGTPILMLTARHELGDRVAGLDAGADDYLTKPFALEELLARLRALLRRSDRPDGAAGLLQVADLTLDPGSRRAHRAGRELGLTKTEFDLLELLMHNQGLVMSRETIYEHIWGYDFETTSNPLDVYIGYLRRKTEGPGESRLIHTVRGVGYVVRRS
jgi:two-component system response regulator MprA